MSCYMTYVQNMLCNMCHVMLSRIRYIMLLYSICSECVMLSYITCGILYNMFHVMLFNMCHVMLYNTCHVMLFNICHLILYNTCHVMLYNICSEYVI